MSAGEEPPLGVAVLGAGMIGVAHATAYLLQATAASGGVPVRLARAVDADPDAAEALARRFGFEAHGTDWRQVLDDPAVQVVSVALPNALHFEVAAALLGAGKHVLCEKPLTLRAEEALALARAAARAGVVAATSLNYRRIPAVAAIRAEVGEGALGEPVHLLAHYHADYAADPMQPFSWRYRKDQAGGGALGDIGIHLIDMARFLCGEVERVDGASLATVIRTRPLPAATTRGHARGVLRDERAEVDNDDLAQATLTFANGCRGTLSVSRIAAGQKNDLGFALTGRRGSARFSAERMASYGLARVDRDGTAAGFTEHLTGPALPYVAEGMAVPAAGVPYGFTEVFAFMVGAFVRAVRAGRPLESGTFRDGYEAQLVAEAIERAAATGRAVALADLRREVEGRLEAARGAG